MRKHINRIISITLAAAMTVSMISSISASAEEITAFPYTLFAASETEGAITTTAGNFCVNGNVCTNGTIVAGGNINVNETKTENAGQDMIYIFDKIDTKYFSGNNFEEHTEDYVLDEHNINICTPTEVLGEAELTGNININTALKAFKDITLNGEVKNTNDSVIYSKYGDIVIDSTNVNLNGLVYAPFGSVDVKAMNLNLNNVVIIADSIVFDCPNVNANYSTNAADFVGMISEPLNIPKDEWQYMKDENGNGLPDFFEDFDNWEKLSDTDGDGLPDSIEEYLGSDVNNTDTDGDGLGDYYEVFVTYTDPTMADTDENGVSDADEDFDEDGLTNLEEFLNNTYPYIDDSDNDGLSDGDEVNEYGTDPLVADTDGDELEDGDEIILGTNPLKQDTDNDGIIDSKEKFQQTYTHKVNNEDCAVTEVIVDMECTGNINRTTTVESVMGVDYLCSEVVGLVGEPFEIETTSEFEEATLTFKIDKDKLGDIPFDNLLFLWYNEEENEFVELETTIDADNNTVSIITTHFSKYMVVDRQAWFDNWREIYARFENLSEKSPSITAICVDCSGSMRTNDKFFYLKEHVQTCYRDLAVQQFINAMFTNDKTSIITFASNATKKCSLTSDKNILLKNASFYSNGGTNANAAINIALNELDGVSGNKSIILMSDGDVNVSEDNIIIASKNKIKIHCIALGESANNDVLKQYASDTGGEFFIVKSSLELEKVYEKLSANNQMNFDYLSDKDKDGLPDDIEISGIPMPNGKLVFTDPNKADSDEDGLDDGYEVGKMRRSQYFPSDVPDYAVSYKFSFNVTSNPTKVDSDGDGYADGPIDSLENGKFNDPRSLECDVFVYKISDSENFVQVYDVDGNKNYGGNQSWIKDSEFYNNNIYADGGCAVAATCDLLLYLKRTNMDFPCEIDFDGLGINNFDYITNEQYVKLFNLVANDYVKPINFLPYKEYLEREQANCFDGIKKVGGNVLVCSYYSSKALFNLAKQEVLKQVTDGTYTWGVMPWDYSNDIEPISPSLNTVRIDLAGLAILSRISLRSQDYNYSDYISDDYCKKTQGIIISSLENNIPVTLMYGIRGQLDFRNWNNPSIVCDERKIGGHYINVTELIVDKISHDEYMKIASWGESYYLKYDSFLKKFGIGGSIFIHEIE